MCGILGIINRDWPVDEKRASEMLNVLRPRGPDGARLQILDSNRVALGHTRLAIIDLTSAGNQPMSNEDGAVWLTANGEIYNYIALRRTLESRGHVFCSNSDSEVIIHAYEEFGCDCVRHLRGIFAFGIYDTLNKSLFLARDHVGVKPLYYYHANGRFIFASLPRAILEADGFNRQLNRTALSLYLAYGNVPAEHCIFEGISKLLPGHWLLFDGRNIIIKKYWRLEYNPVIKDAMEAEGALRNKIEESVHAQSISDVPLGVLLSGGVDSTIITALLSQPGANPLSSFTIGFNELVSDERPYADSISCVYNTVHHAELLDYATACALLPEIVEAHDEPFHLNAAFPYQALARFVHAQNIKVTLGGDGGDELFAGYRWYEQFLREWNLPFKHAWRGEIMRILKHRPTDTVPLAVRRFFAYNGFFNPTSQLKLTGAAVDASCCESVYQILERHWRSDVPLTVAAQLLDFNCFMVNHCLTKVDRSSMAYGVEVRVPFLDIELAQLSFSIDHALIFKQHQRKALLKKTMKGLFPDKMDFTRKKGFSSPVNAWMKKGLAEAGRRLLLQGSLCARQYLSHAAVRRIYSRLPPEKQLLLISAELWMRRWIENDRLVAPDFARQSVASAGRNLRPSARFRNVAPH